MVAMVQFKPPMPLCSRVIARIVPKTWIGRLLAVAWLAACIGVLLFGYEQRAIHDMPVAFTWFLLVLSFPVGSLAVVAVGVSLGSLATALGLQYQPVWHELPIWIAAIVVGYWQWFMFLPREASNYLSRRKDAA